LSPAFRHVLPLLLLAASALAGGYDGKYKDDPRLASIRARLPSQLAAARRIIEVRDAVRIELRDLGKTKSGVAARTKRDEDGFVIVLHTEPLVLRTHDVEKTLVHELVHCMQKERWGARGEVSMPPWVKEGMAVYLAGQFDSRARTLAAHVGRNPVPVDAVTRLVNGLDGRHTLLDYAEDSAAFAGAESRHGKQKTQRFIDALLAGKTPREAARRALGERWATFEEQSRKCARQRLDPLVRDWREALLALRASVDAERFAAALALPVAEGVYREDDAYYRSRALHGAARSAEALELLRIRVLRGSPRRTTLLAQAVAFEVELLGALKRTKERAAALRASQRDLEPFGG